MLQIGQFAQVAQVSVRTLRHYDDLGLLRPAEVDRGSGYRHYRADQLPDLNRILVLKDLGFTLDEIADMREDVPGTEQLVGMLRIRRAEAARAAEEERRRLARVEARIALLSGDPDQAAGDSAVVVKPLRPARLLTASEPTDGFDDDFAPIFQRLYARLYAVVEEAGVMPTGPHQALYDPRADGRIDVVAGVPIPDTPSLVGDGLGVRELGPAARAATLVHVGDMAECARSYEVLQRWMDLAGEIPTGFSREVYLDVGDDTAAWITELQFVLEEEPA